MAESRIPVDLFNPGQVFACLGVLEASDILIGDAAAVFDWRNSSPVFRISAAGDSPPMERVIDFLEQANIVTRVPKDSANGGRWKSQWGHEPTVDCGGEPFPFPDPQSPESLPVLLRDQLGNEVPIEYWGDATRRDNVKFWTGPGGKPGAAILMDALKVVRGKMRQYANDPFALSGVQTVSFRLDWRRDYIPNQDGFSPNNHKRGQIQMVGFPLVEILAAIGMTHARPKRMNKLKYCYGVVGDGKCPPLDPVFHRAALGSDTSPVPGVPFRRFVMELDWPAQEGQARCITQVVEEGE